MEDKSSLLDRLKIHGSITGKNSSGHGDIVKGRNGDLFYVFQTHNVLIK
jgi:hypothetical protein